MALYVPAGRRRRNLIVGLVAAVVIGLVIGGVVGRVTAPTVDDRVASVRDDARSIVGALAATPNEYAKERAGSTEFRAGGGVDQALGIVRQDLDRALGDAIWLDARDRSDLRRALAGLVAAARRGVPDREYAGLVDETTAGVERVFGIGRG
jgi:hypothetical protein